MSNDVGSDVGSARNGESAPGGDGDEDLATKFTRGVADGFAEASLAFSHEVAGSSHFTQLMGRSVAGFIRANARLLDEMATVVRQTTDGVGGQFSMVDSDD